MTAETAKSFGLIDEVVEKKILKHHILKLDKLKLDIGESHILR